MQTFLDDRPIQTTEHTLAAALDAATTLAGARLIVQATADGAHIPEHHLADPPDTAPYCSELRFTTADRASLVRVTLHEAADSLDTLASAHHTTAHLFQTGENDKALGKLRELLDVWQTTEQTVATCQAVEGVSLTDDHTEHRITQASAQLAASLNDIKDALTNRDLTTVADLTAYDLADQTETWADLLRTLADNTTETA